MTAHLGLEAGGELPVIFSLNVTSEIRLQQEPLGASRDHMCNCSSCHCPAEGSQKTQPSVYLVSQATGPVTGSQAQICSGEGYLCQFSSWLRKS